MLDILRCGLYMYARERNMLHHKLCTVQPVCATVDALTQTKVRHLVNGRLMTSLAGRNKLRFALPIGVVLYGIACLISCTSLCERAVQTLQCFPFRTESGPFSWTRNGVHRRERIKMACFQISSQCDRTLLRISEHRPGEGVLVTNPYRKRCTSPKYMPPGD
jgi:hypothetical protein